MSRPERELALLQAHARLRRDLDRVRRSDKALKIGLRLAQQLWEADEGCIVVRGAAGQGPEARCLLPPGSRWDPSVPERSRDGGARDLVWAPLHRRGRRWGWLMLRRRDRPYARREVADLAAFTRTLSELLRRIDRERAQEIRERIDKKVMEQLRPQDLFYQILHGLRSLTRYDHSAAVFLFHRGPEQLELVAEQIAWRKGKSTRIGRRLPLPAEARSLLEAGHVLGFDRAGEGWREWGRRPAGAVARALQPDGEVAGPPSAATPRSAGALLSAPLLDGDGLVGVLAICACGEGALGAWEADAVRRFVPQAAVAIRNLRRAETLEAGMLEAEKKHVMANLARGVSHDVNNALGAMLPLLQQMGEDVRTGRAEPATLLSDLSQLEASVQVCRRIFGGMLAFARGSAHHLGYGNLARATQSTLDVLGEGLRRGNVALQVDVPARLPPVRGAQGDLEQLLLNLAGNARDAMPDGGTLSISARVEGGDVLLTIADTGQGIREEDLQRVVEPFWSTKPHGNGLGLAICRSIVWEMGGRLTIESRAGAGTRLLVRLPLVPDEAGEVVPGVPAGGEAACAGGREPPA